MDKLRVNLGARSYDIAIGSADGGQFREFVDQCAPRASQFLFVSDANTATHAKSLAESLGKTAIAVVPAGESSKSIVAASDLYGRLAEAAADRSTVVMAVGGGVVGDLAGFVAATYNRGLRLVMVPTTLLSMVDSSVGGKVGINLPQGKNLVGAIHQPAGVWINVRFLDTLPDREYRSGLAEVVKYGVILDADFFQWLETNRDAVRQRVPDAVTHIVARSCALKAKVVEQDEREETGLRMMLNYGHTFAHAFESVSGYGTWLHGEAVAAGMVCASRLAERLGMIGRNATDRQVALLDYFGLATRRDKNWNVESLLEVMRRDKKNVGGRMRFVLPTRLGQVRTVDDVPDSLVREILN
jgi:3-dehydroquinate synthase